jgi:hypothetical protein
MSTCASCGRTIQEVLQRHRPSASPPAPSAGPPGTRQQDPDPDVAAAGPPAPGDQGIPGAPARSGRRGVGWGRGWWRSRRSYRDPPAPSSPIRRSRRAVATAHAQLRQPVGRSRGGRAGLAEVSAAVRRGFVQPELGRAIWWLSPRVLGCLAFGRLRLDLPGQGPQCRDRWVVLKGPAEPAMPCHGHRGRRAPFLLGWNTRISCGSTFVQHADRRTKVAGYIVMGTWAARRSSDPQDARRRWRCRSRTRSRTRSRYSALGYR